MRPILAFVAAALGLFAASPAAPGPFDRFSAVIEKAGARDAPVLFILRQTRDETRLYRAEGPGYGPRLILSARSGEGAPSGLSVSDDGRVLAFEQKGEVMILRGEEPPCAVGEGARPALSPDGATIAALTRTGVVVYAARGDCAALAQSLIRISDRPALGLVWSPKGDGLAFEEPKGRARNLAFWSRETGLRRLDNAAMLDVAPAFSPDGGKIAFLRLDPSTDERASQTDEDPPARFLVMEMGLSDLSPRVLWTSPGEDGFARQWRSRTTAPVRWKDGQALIVFSEHQGWQKPYALGADGQMTALGSGACETDGLDIAPDGRIAVSDNCHARTGREVGLIGKDGFEGLSEANQTAMDPVFFNKGSALAYLAGSGDGMDVEVRSGAVAQRLFGLASPNAKSEVAFKAADGLLLHSILMRPPGKGPFPSVIFLHGGPQRQMLSGAEPGGFYARWSAILSDLNARGVAVLILDYRGGPGEGRDFRRIAEVGRAGGAEDRDVLAARRYLIDQGLADPARIALVGDSWGGWLCAYSLSLHSDLFAAGVDVSGVFDLSETGYGPTMAEDLRRKAREASAAGHIETLNAPLLVIHGDLDRTVPYAQAVELTAALKARGAPVEGLTLTGSAHAPRTGADWDLMADRISEFLKRTLINRR